MLLDAFGTVGCVRTAMDLHEVSSGQLYTWRKQAMSGELNGRSIRAGHGVIRSMPSAF